ncbi:hypothetical protein BVRB_5g122160 [Beta vulgaris subsp. vulgaris]|nr:hypothetical protein BVRB_5g122160 [Beta vulgaris subsp. vulgaris]
MRKHSLFHEAGWLGDSWHRITLVQPPLQHHVWHCISNTRGFDQTQLQW